MARVLGVSIALWAVLTVIWLCCGNGLPVTARSERPVLPEFSQNPTQPAATLPEPAAYVVLGELGCYETEGGSLVAALSVCNEGDTVARFVHAVVRQGGRELNFVATYIPPGESVLIPERDGLAYLDEPAEESRLLTAQALSSQFSPLVSVTEQGCDLLLVNLTDTDTGCVRIYYKDYNAGIGQFIGGETYSIVLPQLKAGEKRLLSPYRYAPGFSRVVAVTVEPL